MSYKRFFLESGYFAACDILGAIHATKISGNFALQLNGSFRSNWKSFEKSAHLSRWTTLLGWIGQIEMDRSILLFRSILNPSTPLFGIFYHNIVLCVRISIVLLYAIQINTLALNKTNRIIFVGLSVFRYQRVFNSERRMLTEVPQCPWNILVWML